MKYRLKRFSHGNWKTAVRSITGKGKSKLSKSLTGNIIKKIDEISKKENPDKKENSELLSNLLKNNEDEIAFVHSFKDPSYSPVKGRDNSKYKGSSQVVYRHNKVDYRELTDDELSKGIVNIGDDRSRSAISHEVGHDRYQKSKVGGLLHGLNSSSKKYISNNSPLSSGDVGAVTGLITGFRSEKLKHKGKKEGVLSKNAHWMIPVASNLPNLIEEGAASIVGSKELKKAGSTKEQMKDSNKLLRNAFGTYAANAGIEVAEGLAGRAVGKLAGKSYYKVKDKISKKKDKESEDSDN